MLHSLIYVDFSTGVDSFVGYFTGWVVSQRETYRAFLPVSSFLTRENWWKLLPWHWALQKDAARRLAAKEQVKQFALMPLCSYDAKNVTIDTVVLHGLLLLDVDTPNVPKGKIQFFYINKY